MPKTLGTWMGQKIVAPGVSELFGKRYIWLQDHDGTIYALRLDDNDVPQLV
jgi:hypothetical protein